MILNSQFVGHSSNSNDKQPRIDLPIKSLVGSYLLADEWHQPYSFKDSYMDTTLEIQLTVAKTSTNTKVCTCLIRKGFMTSEAYDSLCIV